MAKKQMLLSVIVIGLALSGCSSSKSNGPSSTSAGNSLLDALTDFSVALNSNDFNKAMEMLSADEKNQLTGPDGGPTSEAKKQLKAFNLQDVQRMIKNPRIKLVGGKLTGIVPSLPPLEHTKPGYQEPEMDETLTNPEPVGGQPQTEEGAMEEAMPPVESEETAPEDLPENLPPTDEEEPGTDDEVLPEEENMEETE